MIVGVPMPVDAKEALTRKLGPLPAWGWGVAIGGAILVAKLFRKSSGASVGTTAPTSIGGGIGGTATDATTQPGDPFSGPNSLITQLQSQVGDLTTQLTGLQTKQTADETQLTKDTANLTKAGTTIAGLSGTISTLSSFQTLQTKLIALINKRASLLGDSLAAQTALNTYRDSLRTCTTQACKDKYNALITSKTASITSWNAQLATVNGQITTTQNLLNGSKAA